MPALTKLSFFLLFYLFLAVFVFLVRRWARRSLGQKILTALLLGLIGVVFWGIFADLFLPLLTGLTLLPTAPVAGLILLTSILLVLVKFRFTQPGLLLARFFAYTTLVLALSGFFLGAIFILEIQLSAATAAARQLIIATILSVIAVLIFQPFRRGLEAIFDPIFAGKQYNPNKLAEKLRQTLVAETSLRPLLKSLLSTITTGMRISKAAFVLYSGDRSRLIKVEVGLKLPQKEKIKSILDVDSLKVGEELPADRLKNNLDRLGVAAVIPLKSHPQNLGVLLLGPKEDRFYQSDLFFLEKAADEIIPTIAKLLAFDELQRFNVTLKAAVKKSTKKLENLNAKLEDLDRLKDEFVTLTSHELRTPITAIKSYLWMALTKKGDQLDPKLAHYLDRAYNSTERMIKLVNDLLNVSRIESGRIDFHPQGMSLAALARAVVDEVAGEAKKRGLTLKIKPQDLPLVYADWWRIREVLINLVGNSLKFTPKEGKITISFRTVDDVVETQVADSGKGIAEKDQPRLFHKFGLIGGSGSYTSTRETGGSGLGLYICKALIDLNGGKIWAKSKLGAGSTFTFSLPVATDEQLARSGIFDPEQKLKEVVTALPGAALPFA